MKNLYEDLEWFLTVMLSACSCIGIFFMSCYVRYLILGSVTVKFILIMFVVSVLLSWGMTELKNEVRYRRLLMEAQKDDQADELFEHLRV